MRIIAEKKYYCYIFVTPRQCEFARKPPEFLKHGDVIETEITGVGIMRNMIRAET